MPDTASQVGYWDRVATEKRFSHPLRLDWLAKHATSHSWLILDYGCGYGRTLSELAAAGYQNLAGADFSEAMLSRAREEVPGAMLVRNDGHSLPFQTSSLDAVLLFAVLTCIPADEEQRELMREIERVLRPAGVIYISDLLVNTDQRNRTRYESFLDRYGCYGVFELPEGVVVRHHQSDWIEELTRPFHRAEYQPFEVTTMNGNLSSAFQYLGLKESKL